MAESLRSILIREHGKQCMWCGRMFCSLSVEPIVASSPVSLSNCVLLCEPCATK
ncbi:hypothetical protein MOKP125_50080 [Mycobacterium avium subsp. hominissuis]